MPGVEPVQTCGSAVSGTGPRSDMKTWLPLATPQEIRRRIVGQLVRAESC